MPDMRHDMGALDQLFGSLTVDGFLVIHVLHCLLLLNEVNNIHLIEILVNIGIRSLVSRIHLALEARGSVEAQGFVVLVLSDHDGLVFLYLGS